MSTNHDAIKESNSLITWKRWLRRLVRFIIFFGIIGGILFGSAGRFDWLPAWLMIILYALYLLLVIIWSSKKAPELLEERRHVAPNVKFWDKLINVIYTILMVCLLVIAGLDSGRFRWSAMPVGYQVLGMSGLITCGWVIWWVIATNTFASRWARIQEERGQAVVSSGPYQYVRHPMYVAIIVLCICLPLELGSWWGLIPGGLIGMLFVARAKLEDDMLQEELEGYQAYTQKVRYRLLPGIW